MIQLFNKVKAFMDGKKAYTALIGAAIPPMLAIFRDIGGNMSFFQIMASTEFNELMLALGAIFIRGAVAKNTAMTEQGAGAAIENAAEPGK